jgi:cell volume regulation protein A
VTTSIIITFCTLLVIAYVFDLTSQWTKIPSVILLLLLGWGFRRITIWSGTDIPDLTPILPVLGSVGLILIVLEGALELEFNSSKFRILRISFLGALLPIVLIAFGLGYLIHLIWHIELLRSVVNMIPLSVISSSIAIPSARNLAGEQKEFILYESSLSDIVGVLLFNFFALNESISLSSFTGFTVQVVLIFVVSFIATLALSALLRNIEHKVKFVPIILLVVLIYEISKIYHLPGLVFILFFGLCIGNLDELKKFKWINNLRPDTLNREVIKFREITIEAAFLIRSLFFLLFGYLIETSELLHFETFVIACCIVFTIYFLRAIQLRLSKLPLQPLLFIAPRGLITILLFLSIKPELAIGIINKTLITQVIILTSLMMMIGIMTTKSAKSP